MLFESDCASLGSLLHLCHPNLNTFEARPLSTGKLCTAVFITSQASTVESSCGLEERVKAARALHSPQTYYS